MAGARRGAFLLCLGAVGGAAAAVLPEQRADYLYHRYDGGGAVIQGPSLLLRKNLGNSVSIGLNHYVDRVTSASIDVLVTASEYTERREENSIALDYLRQKTTLSLSFTESLESDFDANTVSFGISQDLFGDLTTLSMAFALGDNQVGQNGNDSFAEEATVRSYRVGVSQIVTTDLVLALTAETITDEGYLNNPYRQVRYFDATSPQGYSFQGEVYPNTRTSHAFALRANYFLAQRAALHGGVRFFSDTWQIEGTTYELGYTLPYAGEWILEASLRFHDQSGAEFYSDLFPYRDAQDFLARDKELSTFTSTTLGVGASYDLGLDWAYVERGSVTLQVDWIRFDYEDFRDLTAAAPAGDEPLYRFDATVTRLFASLWF